jgi:hypothetical protein
MLFFTETCWQCSESSPCRCIESLALDWFLSFCLRDHLESNTLDIVFASSLRFLRASDAESSPPMHPV